MPMIWTETDRPELPEGAAPPPLQQHPFHVSAWEGAGGHVRAFALRAGHRVLGSALVAVRRWPCLAPVLGEMALLSRGPVWAPDLPDGLRRAALRDLLSALALSRRIVAATPDPVGGADPLTGAGWLTMRTPACHAVRALSDDPVALRAGLHGKWRNRLRRAEAAGLTVREARMPDDPGHWLLRADAAQARAKRYRALPASYALGWARAGGPEAARIFMARKGRGAPLAGLLVLRHGEGATYHIGWSGPEGRACDAQTLLLWHAMEALGRAGVTRFDLGLVDTETAPGLARFKLGTGAQVERLGATRLRAPGTGLFLPAHEKGRPGGGRPRLSRRWFGLRSRDPRISS